MPKLPLSLVLAIHEDLLRRYGGSPGILDLGRLEAALERPWAGFAGQEIFPTPWEKAAAYLTGIAKGHPFVEGNKRTAFAVADIYLRLSGFRLTLSDEEAFSLVVGVAQCHQEVGDVAKAFRQHLDPPP
ncbi:type II toxin-antitoxin system death-on-curing family toxin [Thermus antranikianii]|uniref:Type II toxin-antitoxin system death-on-curing family toxin n=1 Tax=Thermus antranikianii TaxID=88190 RepID=A0ABY7RQE2_9DEIN|nr:type II toxin-antitoxin system death-on-curing family toxin [Thermus antranikianii]QWK21524.1 MAG: type II toxin-antitoxin system death-on-curing family toxin [Thermus antranikianii]WCM39718.1 type II toxin-antitoxin system death-on-curing family toxin [Thermus antranikianii]